VWNGKNIGVSNLSKVAEPVFKIYKDYKELEKNKKLILQELEKEEEKFNLTLEKGLKEIKKMSWEITVNEKISGKKAFLLHQSYGFPIEMIKEIALFEWGVDVDEKGFEAELKKHQKLSRTATKGKFAAGLADHSEKTTKYHTATHLLHKALKIILGENVKQMGSNITQERLRFDFSFSRKLTEKEIKDVENLINKQIKRNLRIYCEEMPYENAIKSGALSYFREKYPKIVKVYTVKDFSKEICTGPHVENTKNLGKFKIIKEESSSSGVRRIKAVLE
jgi:alanyl-tRNA synthetase